MVELIQQRDAAIVKYQPSVLHSQDFELEGDDLVLERHGNLCLLGAPHGTQTMVRCWSSDLDGT